MSFVGWHRSCVPSWRMYAGYRRWLPSSAVCWQSNVLGQEITQPVRWPLTGNTVTVVGRPERGSGTRARPETTWPCNFRPSRVAFVSIGQQAVSTRSQDINRSHGRPAHSGRSPTCHYAGRQLAASFYDAQSERARVLCRASSRLATASFSNHLETFLFNWA